MAPPAVVRSCTHIRLDTMRQSRFLTYSTCNSQRLHVAVRDDRVDRRHDVAGGVPNGDGKRVVAPAGFARIGRTRLEPVAAAAVPSAGPHESRRIHAR